jgi:hypothetical protein
MVPALEDYIKRLDHPRIHNEEDDSGRQNWRDNPRVHVYTLAQNYWHYRFKAPHHTLKAHERNPFWVRRTVEQCQTWGCPVPSWALDYLMRTAAGCAGYRWPTDRDVRRADAYIEAIRKSSVPEENRVYDAPWDEKPKLNQEIRRLLKATMADLQGTNTSEETVMRLLSAVDDHVVTWIRLCFPMDHEPLQCSPCADTDQRPKTAEGAIGQTG